MLSGRWRFVKNALANIVTGAGAAALSVALPYFFVRYLSSEQFAIWVLVLQIGAYVNFLNFGLQTAVGRYVAHTLGVGDQTEAERVLAAAIQLLSILGLAGLAVIALLCWLLPVIFTDVPTQMVGEARDALLWVGSALALGLPFSAFLGTFIGMQRNELPALAVLVGKVGLAIALIVVVKQTHDLLAAAQTYFFGLVATYLFQTTIFAVVCRQWHFRIFERLAAVRKELVGYCVSLAVWSVAMLLVAGLDTTIVGVFAFSAVAAYGVSLGAVNFLVGILQATFSPLVQLFALRHARRDEAALYSLLESSSAAATLFLLFAASWSVATARFLLPIWIGPKLSEQALPLFGILVVANVIRLSSAPYSFYLVATGQQRFVIVSPLLEGFSNLIVSIVGVIYFGALGVAVATLIGGTVGVSGHYLYNMPRTIPGDFSRFRFFRICVGEPFLITLPLILACVASYFFALSALTTVLILAVATGPVLLRIWGRYRYLHRSISASNGTAAGN